MIRPSRLLFVLPVLLLVPEVAEARVSVLGTAFGAGMMDVTTSLDRLFALLALGAWATGSGAVGGRAALVAVGAALLGAALAALGVVVPRGGDLPAAAAIVAGLLAFAQPRLPPVAVPGLVGLLAVPIGYVSGGSFGYWAGFLWGVFLSVAAGGGVSAIGLGGPWRADRLCGAAALVIGLYDIATRL